ncbi:glycosyltransferase family protein [Neolewinella agarilytica]|uniref:Dolichyl-phosphate-mannose-protein mannosyltransferase n=1 Tax=Neolewinella agarilytica TaxID=478744 RepID=A0A1H9MS46_9BACT|nr:hypothetical protein [Neolewinella agarilytica]SER26458.1 hypothetical protein SAMN05444359_13120 [Neolewinella agarilytica]
MFAPLKESRVVLYLVFASMAITSLVQNDVFQGKADIVKWDGYGYYAYLPAIFVYGDVETYAFAEDHFDNYEISNEIYQLMEVDNGSRFPIYNIGMAVVWTPGFLLAHGLVKATGIAPADGMSFPYQFSLVITSLLVIFLGFFYLRRFLLRFYTDQVVALVLFGIGLATNLFYYTTEGPDVTHMYLFTGYALFLYAFGRLVDSDESARGKWIIRCGLLAGLMCLIRSSEIVLFAIPAFYGLKNRTTLQRNFWRTLPIFGIALAVFSLQLIYYKTGTGSWFQDGYAGLSFDWLLPHLYEGFIGYRRGWLVYTPLMAFALAGVFWLPKAWRLPFVIFLIGNSYILFSWHIWWYGNTFGSRPVVQSYALLAFPLAALVAWVLGADAGAGQGRRSKAKWPKYLVTGLVLAFTTLNLFQHWQYNQRILPLDFVNKTYYWQVFGKTKLDRKDYVYRDTDEKLPKGSFRATPLLSLDTLLSIPPKSGREFTNLLEYRAAHDAEAETWLRADLSFSYFGETYDKWKFPSIVTEHRRGDEMLKWIQVKIPPTMDTPERDSLTFSISLPGLQQGDIVKQYLWNLSRDSMVVRRYEAEMLR